VEIGLFGVGKYKVGHYLFYFAIEVHGDFHHIVMRTPFVYLYKHISRRNEERRLIKYLRKEQMI
jgi:hypothetical protein